MVRIISSLGLAIALGISAPAASAVADSASAQRASTGPVSSTPVHEPADFALFAAGVVGLFLGRRGSRSRPD